MGSKDLKHCNSEWETDMDVIALLYLELSVAGDLPHTWTLQSSIPIKGKLLGSFPKDLQNTSKDESCMFLYFILLSNHTNSFAELVRPI